MAKMLVHLLIDAEQLVDHHDARPRPASVRHRHDGVNAAAVSSFELQVDDVRGHRSIETGTPHQTAGIATADFPSVVTLRNR